LLAALHIDINAEDEDGDTALHRAARAGDLTAVNMLLANPNCDIDARNDDGQSALEIAEEEGHQAVVRVLHASKGFTPGTMDALAAEQNSSGIGASDDISIDADRKHKPKTLHLVPGRGDRQRLAELLAQPKKRLNKEDGDGCTTFDRAVIEGDDWMVSALLAVPGIDFDHQMGLDEPDNFMQTVIDDGLEHVEFYDKTPFEVACNKGNVQIVQLLLAMPEIVPDVETSPVSADKLKHLKLAFGPSRITGYISTAREKGQRLLIKVLQQHRIPAPQASAQLYRYLQQCFPADPFSLYSDLLTATGIPSNAWISRSDAELLDRNCSRVQFGKCKSGEVPGLFAALRRFPQVATELMTHALMLGFHLGHYRDAAGLLEEVIERSLTQAGMRDFWNTEFRKFQSLTRNINLHRIDGQNLLCKAAAQGNERMIHALVELGTFVNLPSANGMTPIATAARHRQWGAFAELVSHGALPMLPDPEGKSALHRIVDDFCTDDYCTEALVRLIVYLRMKGISLDIPIYDSGAKSSELQVEDTDEENSELSSEKDGKPEKKNMPEVLLSDLMASYPQSWEKYGLLMFGVTDQALPLGKTAPGNLAAVEAVASASEESEDAMQVDAPRRPADELFAMLGADDDLDSFTTWLTESDDHLQWQDPQSGQTLLHLAVACSNADAVELLLVYGADPGQVDSEGRTPAQVAPVADTSSAAATMERIAALLRR
jgi:ankyrin repeat protein